MGVIWHFPALAFCPLPQQAQQVVVRQVVDGDTLRLVDGRSVRLIGINAPEIGRKGRTSEPYAEAARRRLQALVNASDGRIGLVPGVRKKTSMAAHWRISTASVGTILKHGCSARVWATGWQLPPM